jgi:hypothetical protein
MPLTNIQRLGQYTRISVSDYDADIAAAEERGRASAAQATQSTQAPSPAQVEPMRSSAPTKEQEGAMAAVKALQQEAAAREKAAAENDDPKALAANLSKYVDEQRQKGRRISLALATKELRA